MNIFDRTDGVLRILNVPFYDTMPEFADGEEPDLYIVYSVYDSPALRGDGRLEAVEYTVTINIIGTNAAETDALQLKLIPLMEEYDYSYGGCNYEIDSDFPATIRRITDFKTVIER